MRTSLAETPHSELEDAVRLQLRLHSQSPEVNPRSHGEYLPKVQN